MSLNVVRMALSVEQSDDFHLSRILLLLKATGKQTNRPVEGITKLAKLDFLVRYPAALVRVLQNLGRSKQAGQIPDVERDTIEGAMIRFRYGPWDERYRRWLALLAARGLVDVYQSGATVHIKLTISGGEEATKLAERDEFSTIFSRCKLVATCVGDCLSRRRQRRR
jgi:hypothetical protein